MEQLNWFCEWVYGIVGCGCGGQKYQVDGKIPSSGRAENKERAIVTKADIGSDDNLERRKERHVDFGIVNSATNKAKGIDNVEGN
jgi:hypothetical protein